MNRRRASRRQRGFTLIELIIVITIILFLMATVTLVIGSVITNARVAATRATLTKLNGLVQQRIEAFQRSVDRAVARQRPIQPLPTDYSNANYVFNMFQRAVDRNDVTRMKWDTYLLLKNSTPPADQYLVDSASDRTWAVLIRKLVFMATFPQSFREIGGPDDATAALPYSIGYPGTPADDDGDGVANFYPNGAPDPQEFGMGTYNGDVMTFGTPIQQRMLNPQAHNPATESAELLYLILTQSKLFGVAPVDENEFTTAEVQDTDQDGLPEFVDAWGRPLRFYRWPTHLLRCGEDLNDNGSLDAGEDFNNNGQLDAPGPLAIPYPLYANLLSSTLPSLRKNDTTLARDPDDAFGVINIDLIRKGSPTVAVELARRQRFEALLHTPDTFHQFLIVSAGPDGVLGLFEPGERLAGKHLARLTQHGDPTVNPINDNITNRQK